MSENIPPNTLSAVEQKLIADPLPLVARVIRWNEHRYDQVYNEKLQRSLIVEEATEGLIATTHVDILDSIGDQLFVFIGSLWKAGLLESPQKIYCLEEALMSENPYLLESLFIKDCLAANKPALLFGLSAVLNSIEALAELKKTDLFRHSKGHKDRLLYVILAIITTSNETKTIVKTEADKKANVDKGSLFVAPTANLKSLIRGIYHG